jgi:uncharacterized GH25 family protein
MMTEGGEYDDGVSSPLLQGMMTEGGEYDDGVSSMSKSPSGGGKWKAREEGKPSILSEKIN